MNNAIYGLRKDAFSLVRAPSTGGLSIDSNGTLTNPFANARWGHPANAVDVFSRLLCPNTNNFLSSNRVYLTYFLHDRDITVSQIAACSFGTPASGTTLCRMGLYTVDDSTGALTLVARTDSDTTLFSVAGTLYTRSFSTTGGYPLTYTLTAGTRYAAGVIWVGTSSSPGVYGASQNSVLAFQSPVMAAFRNSGDADLPSSLTPASNAEARLIWFRLS